MSLVICFCRLCKLLAAMADGFNLASAVLNFICQALACGGAGLLACGGSVHACCSP